MDIADLFWDGGAILEMGVGINGLLGVGDLLVVSVVAMVMPAWLHMMFILLKAGAYAEIWKGGFQTRKQNLAN